VILPGRLRPTGPIRILRQCPTSPRRPDAQAPHGGRTRAGERALTPHPPTTAETEDVAGLHVLDHPASGSDRLPLVVVLVHGSLDRATSFARVVRRLPDLHVVTYDRRGYHRSRPALPLATSLEDHVADLVAIVDGRPSVVVGHSYGGDVALGAAVAAPDVVRAVGAYEPPLPWSGWWPSRANRESGPEDPGAFAESFFRRVVSDDAWNRLPENARAERRADGAELVAELMDLRRDHSPIDFASLAAPVVLGRGSRSLPHHRQAIDALVELLPATEVIEFPGAAHGAHISQPDAFAAFVRRVVERGGENRL
jgi:pimeloyl-ACP methyl ester carboxylesterase